MIKFNKKTILVPRESAVLREVAATVKSEEIGSKKLDAIINKMQKALHAEHDGVAIAAPQIGVSLRIFIVSGNALSLATEEKKENQKVADDLILINPVILKVSKKKKNMEEGCLSLRYLYGEVLRHEKITITAHDRDGRRLTIGASGLLAQIFQHEIDHLNGVLFTDKAKNVRDLPPTDDTRKKDLSR